MDNVAQNLSPAEVTRTGVSVYTQRQLESLVKNSVKGSKCPHAARWEIVEWSIHINGNVVLHVNVQCKHEQDRQTAEFAVAL